MFRPGDLPRGVEAKDFQALVEQLGELTAGQREALVEAIKRKSSVKDAIAFIETRFAAAPRCGHCRSEKVATSAKNPLTRYKCTACGKTFNALTGTPLARRHPDRRISYRLRQHADLVPEHFRSKATITPPPAPKRRGRQPGKKTDDQNNG